MPDPHENDRADEGATPMPPLPRPKDALPDDPLTIARFTRAVLEENGLGYRDQEMHTGVAPSLVYGLAQGQRVPARAVLQFASVAALKARRPETRQFWAATFERLSHERDEVPPGSVLPERASIPADPTLSPEEIGALYAGLRLTESRAAVAALLASLRAVECAAAAVVAARTPGDGATEPTDDAV